MKCHWLLAKSEYIPTRPKGAQSCHHEKQVSWDGWHLPKSQLVPFLGRLVGDAPSSPNTRSAASCSCFHGKRILGEGARAHQLWKFCTGLCFWDRRSSSSRMALMREAEEWPGCRSSVELVG